MKTKISISTIITLKKALSCRYNMDTNRVEAQFNDGTIVNFALL